MHVSLNITDTGKREGNTMITLQQMQDEYRGVEYSNMLTQFDIDEINKLTTDWDKARKIAASWAHQYYFDGIAESKQAEKESYYAYGRG